MSERSAASEAVGCIAMLGVALALLCILTLAGWVVFVDAPRTAGLKAVCFERGGVWLTGGVRLANGSTRYPACIRPPDTVSLAPRKVEP